MGSTIVLRLPFTLQIPTFGDPACFTGERPELWSFDWPWAGISPLHEEHVQEAGGTHRKPLGFSPLVSRGQSDWEFQAGSRKAGSPVDLLSVRSWQAHRSLARGQELSEKDVSSNPLLIN